MVAETPMLTVKTANSFDMENQGSPFSATSAGSTTLFASRMAD